MKRDDIHFMVNGDRCAAWLYMPDGVPPFPAVVMAHGFGGTRHMRLDAYAERFAAAGFAVLVFDYRHFGDSGGEPRQIINIGWQLADWRAAIMKAKDTPEIDRKRVALWGSSFSGGHVVKLSAEDDTIAACISQSPFMDGRALFRANGLMKSLCLGLCSVLDLCKQALGLKPFLVRGAGAPGSLAAITTPDAEQGLRALIPSGYTPVEEIAAGIFIRLPWYRPGLSSGLVKCPMLFCLADLDAVAPVGPALEAAGRAHSAEVCRYPMGHFDVYVGDGFERSVKDQIDFLIRHNRRS